MANSFEVVAREWHAKHLRSWTDKRAETIIRRLELNVLPWLGGKPVADEVFCARRCSLGSMSLASSLRASSRRSRASFRETSG